MLRRIFLSAFVLAALVLHIGLVSAQMPDVPEHLIMRAGEVLEILPVHGMRSARAAWILTQDRNFLEAGQDMMFRTRIVQPGEYTLTLDVTDDDTGTRLHRVLVLDIRSPEEQLPEEGPALDGHFIRSSVSFNEQGWLILAQESNTVRMTPVDGRPGPLSIDTDTTVDLNDDGDPANDSATDGSYFTAEGTPLTLWFIEPLTGKQLSVFSGTQQDSPRQLIDVYSEVFARQQGIVSLNARILSSEDTEGNVSFSVRFDGIAPEVPLLVHWMFGDAEESMQTTPTHKYALRGEYTVEASVINILTGQEVAHPTRTFTVQNAPESAPAGTSSESSSSSQAPTEQSSSAASTAATASSSSRASSGGGGISWMLLAIIFAGSMIAGVVLLLIVSVLRKRLKSLPQKLEQMEKKVLEKKAGAAPAVLEVKAEQKKEEPKPEPPAPKAPEPPPVSPGDAPSWLTAGLQAAAPSPAPAPATPSATPAIESYSSQAPAPSPAASFSAPAPQAAWTPPAPAPAAPEPVPAWLQKGLSEAEKKGMTPDSPLPPAMSDAAPAPEPKPEPPAPTPAPVPVPAPEPTPVPVTPQPMPPAPQPEQPSAPLPDWLKPAVNQNASQPATTPAPAPAPDVKPEAPAMPNPEPQPSEPSIGRPGEALPKRLGGGGPQPQNGPRPQQQQQQQRPRPPQQQRPQQPRPPKPQQPQQPKVQPQPQEPKKEDLPPPPAPRPVPPTQTPLEPIAPVSPALPSPAPVDDVRAMTPETPKLQDIPQQESTPAPQQPIQEDQTIGILRVESLEGPQNPAPPTQTTPPSGN